MGRFGGGRCFVRPSGTEDVVRVYAEAETQARATPARAPTAGMRELWHWHLRIRVALNEQARCRHRHPSVARSCVSSPGGGRRIGAAQRSGYVETCGRRRQHAACNHGVIRGGRFTDAALQVRLATCSCMPLAKPPGAGLGQLRATAVWLQNKCGGALPREKALFKAATAVHLSNRQDCDSASSSTSAARAAFFSV
eukprot:3237422-Pleurochrysis_carterae.AAC.1